MPRVVRIEAPVADVIEVIEDYESYPEWADVRTWMSVARRGQTGDRGGLEVDVPVLGKAAYTLRTGTRRATARSWVTTEARGAIRDIRGEYLLHEVEATRPR